MTKHEALEHELVHTLGALKIIREQCRLLSGVTDGLANRIKEVLTSGDNK